MHSRKYLSIFCANECITGCSGKTPGISKNVQNRKNKLLALVRMVGCLVYIEFSCTPISTMHAG